MNNILVIGAGHGIGLELVKSLKNTTNVFAVSRSFSEELNNTGVPVIWEDALTTTLNENFLPEVLHGVVYCPGSISLKPFNRFTLDDFENDFRQNVLGAVRILQQVLPNLKKAKGAGVVLFSTVASKLGMPFHASIATSKAAVEGLTKSLAAEWAGSKIRVNALALSLTDTQLASGLLNTPEKREAAAKRHPLQEIGDPKKIASLVSFLLEEKSDWITGQIIGVDGGLGSVKL
ncbi:MAG: SDR family oxidoreductase [Saprospiraceae bacterium]|nr:SDR family oxidoreductase [Saprospiraceae bacterium]